MSPFHWRRSRDRAGGRLKYPGVHYRSDSKESSSKVLLSLLRAVGLPLKEFGATTIVPPGWRGVVDEHGNLRFEREART